MDSDLNLDLKLDSGLDLSHQHEETSDFRTKLSIAFV